MLCEDDSNGAASHSSSTGNSGLAAVLKIMPDVQKNGSANGNSTRPEALSQQDVKQQAKETRTCIGAWKKKQPVKAQV